MLAMVLTMSVAAAGPCNSGELVVMGCSAGKKTIAVCASPAAAPTSMQYRYGPPGKPELTFPAVPSGFSGFRLENQNLISGTSTTLTFKNGDTTYEVYTQDGKDAGGGVNVSKGDKRLANVACKGDFTENWSIIEARMAAGAPAGASGAAPTPLAGKSRAVICNDDALLLLEQSFDVLASGGFKKTCCVKGALGADDERCELDWPWSDVPSCSELDVLRNTLFARYGFVFQTPELATRFAAEPWYAARADFKADWMPVVAQKNAALLKDYAGKGFRCELGLATPAQCAAAGTAYSLKLFRAAKGTMDGVQQNDIAQAVVAECQAGWGGRTALCLAEVKKDCGDVLSSQESAVLRAKIKAIAPN